MAKIEPQTAEYEHSPEAIPMRVFIVLNPAAGRADPETIEQAFARNCSDSEQCFSIHHLQPEDNLKQIIGAALDDGHDCVVAAGGDGTISAVANVLANRDVPLAIVPAGTANVLARELEIPLDIDEACKLIMGRHSLCRLDAMELHEQVAILQIGIGLGSLMIRDTSTRAKKLLGRTAYLGTAVARLAGYEPRVFNITVDGERHRHHALHLVVANGGVMGQPPFRWGPDIDPADGRINVAVLQARTLLDLLALAWKMLRGKHRQNRRARYYQASDTISIATNKPLPIQADGEIIGETPLDVRVRRSLLPVIVPYSKTGN